MSTSSKVTVRLSLEASQYIAEAQKAGKVGEDAMRKVERTARTTDRAVQDIGSAAGKMALATGAALGAVVLTTASFDKGMSKVAASTGESAAALRQLREAAMEAGADTAFSATEAAAGIEELAKAGVSTSDILSGALTGALDLAAAGELDVAAAAEYTATALTQFQLAGSQATHVADLLAAGAGKAQGSVDDMALALKYAGVPASNLGMSIEETTGTIALFASNGIIGEQAGTSFRGMLASLTSPSQAAAKEMDRLGISVFDAQGEFVGMGGVAEQLNQRLSGLTEAERANALGRIFGNEQLQAANVLYREGGDAVTLWTSKVNDSGFAAENAGQKMDNLAGDWERLTGSLETALIGTGAESQGSIRTTVQALEKVVDVYTKMSPAGQSAAFNVGLATTAVASSAFVFAKGTEVYTSARDALTTLGEKAPKTARGLRMVTTAAAGYAALELMAAGIEALEAAMDESLPTSKELAGSLLDLQAGKSVDLTRQGFDDLGQSIHSVEKTSDGALGKLYDLAAFGDKYGAGGVLGALWDTPVDEVQGYREQLDALDAALAELATMAGPEQATASLNALAQSQNLTESQTQTLISLLPQYRDALAGAANEAKLAAGSAGGLGAAQGQAASQAEEHAAALKAARSAARETAGAFFNLGDSLDDSSVSLSDWLRQMEEQATALRRFRINAQTAADRGLRQGLIDALEEAGPAGALRMAQLADATDAEIARANGAWRRGQAEINKYANAAGNVPREVSTTVSLKGTRWALAEMAKIKAHAESVDGTYYVNFVVNQTNAVNKRRDPNFPQAEGSVLSFYANGDVRNGHVAQMAPAGAWRVWAEDETEGESYIPHAPSKRKRSLEIWAETGRILGATGFADGAVRTGRSGRSGPAGSDWPRTLDESMRLLARQTDKTGDSMKGLKRRADDLKDDLDKVREKRSNLNDATTSRFAVDLFGMDSAWGESGSAADRIRDTTGDLRDRIKLQRRLKKQGLSDDALAEVLAQGDNDDLRAILNTPGEAKKIQRLYRQYAKASERAGAGAGQLAYGAETREIVRELRKVREVLRKQRKDHETGRRQSKQESERQSHTITAGVTSGVNKAANAALRTTTRRTVSL